MSELFSLFAKLTMDTSEFDEGIDSSEEKAFSFGNSLKTAAKVGVAAVAAVGTAAMGAGTALVKSVGSIAEYGDNIDKMSQKMGMSAQAYQEWDAVMQHSGTSMETMKASMKTLANAAETGSDAFEKLGISQEELKTLNQQELFERTIAALQNVEDETTRTYLAGKTLGKGATELGALLNTSAEDTQAMRDRVRELGGVMSDEAVKAAAVYQDSLQDMTTAIDGVKRGLMSEFLPSLTTVMDGITNIFAGDTTKGMEQLQDGIDSVFSTIDTIIPKAIKTGETILVAIGNAIGQNLPMIAQRGTELIINLVTGAVSAIPRLAEGFGTVLEVIWDGVTDAIPRLLLAGVEIVGQLGQGLAEGIPAIIEKVVEMLLMLDQSLLEGLDGFFDAGVSLLTGLIDGIVTAVPILLEAIPEIITRLLTRIIEDLPRLLAAGVQVLKALVNGIIATIPVLISAVPQIFAAVQGVWATLDWNKIGKDAITWIKNGVNELFNTIPDTLKSLGNRAIEWFKGVDWKEAGKSVVDFVKNGVLAVPTLIASALRELGNSAADAFRSIDWYSLGSSVIEGIVNGLKNGVQWIKDTARDVAKNALNAAKDFLGIKSPSRVFRTEVGAMIAKGLSLGIEDETPAAVESAETMAKRTLTPFDDLDIPTYDMRAQGETEETDVVAMLKAIYEFLRGNWNNGDPIPIILDGSGTVGYYDRRLGQAATAKQRGVI